MCTTWLQLSCSTWEGVEKSTCAKKKHAGRIAHKVRNIKTYSDFKHIFHLRCHY